jgi:hypothetical protein
MTKKPLIVLAAALMLMTQRAWAQTVEPSTKLTEIKSTEECTLYSFNYPSVSATGEPTVLSSALFAWTPSERQTTDSIESLHIYSHITITSDEQRPSTTDGVSTEQVLWLYLPGSEYGNGVTGEKADYVARCIVIAPDYEGYGVTKNVSHPYLSQKLTGQQVLDAVKYGLELYQNDAKDSEKLLPMKHDWRSFCLGFSQGGAVSLATQREIEEQGLSDELHFKGTICGDGPYDLISVIRYYVEDDGTSYDVETPHRKGMITMPVVMPLIIKGMFDTYPDMAAYKIEDFLSQQLIDTGILEWIDSKEFSTTNIADKWYNQLKTGVDAGDRHYTPEQMAELFVGTDDYKVWAYVEKMFTPAIYEYLEDASNFDNVPEVATNAAQALHRALVYNSVSTGWEPQHRIQFFHSKYDVIVPYGNYLAFSDAHQQDEGSIYRINNTFYDGDHIESGTMFMLMLLTTKTYGEYFNWICEGSPTPSGIDSRFSPAMPLGSAKNTWHTLDGRRLNNAPTRRGFYIMNGKKYVIK